MFDDTPVGRQAQWVMDALGTEVDDDALRARFNDGFLDAVPVDQLRAVLQQLGAEGLELVGASGTDTELRAMLKAGDDAVLMQIAVEAAEPHRIAGLLFQPAGPSVGKVLEDAQPSRDVHATLTEHVVPYADELKGEHAGCVVAIAFDGATYVKVFGATPEDAIFEIGSITKTMTATVLASMVADGTVGLDDDIARWLPDGSTPRAPITLRQLASHTSGLPRLPVNMEVTDPADPYATFSIDDLFAGLPDTPLAPQGTARYSNLGYALLGQVLARAGGAPYEDLVQRYVFDPIGMSDSRFGGDASNPRRVPGHHDGEVVPCWTGVAIAPAGRIESSARDVLAYGIAHATAPAGSPMAMTHERQQAEGMAIGLAWVIESPDAGPVIWHNGGTGGFRSFLGIHPPSSTVVVALANADDGDGPDVAAASVLGALIA